MTSDVLTKGRCPTCDARVSTMELGECLACGSETLLHRPREPRRATHGWCPQCFEEVAVDVDGECLWCSTECLIRRPEGAVDTRPVLGPERRPEGWVPPKEAQPAPTGREPSHASRNRNVHDLEIEDLRPVPPPPIWPIGIPPPEEFEEVPTRTYRRRSDSPLTERLLHEARWRYFYDGWGFVRIARLMLPLTVHHTDNSLATALRNAFKREGWPRRDRIQATNLASWHHGLKARGVERDRATGADAAYRRWFKVEHGIYRPNCASETVRGEACDRPANRGSLYCQVHGESADHNEEILAAARARRDANMVPINPWVRWLNGLVAERGTQLAVAGALGCDGTMVSLWRLRRDNDGNVGARATIHSRTVRKYLARVEGAPAYAELYP